VGSPVARFGVFHTFVTVGRGRGYRVDYGVTELAIIVAGLKKL